MAVLCGCRPSIGNNQPGSVVNIQSLPQLGPLWKKLSVGGSRLPHAICLWLCKRVTDKCNVMWWILTIFWEPVRLRVGLAVQLTVVRPRFVYQFQHDWHTLLMIFNKDRTALYCFHGLLMANWTLIIEVGWFRASCDLLTLFTRVKYEARDTCETFNVVTCICQAIEFQMITDSSKNGPWTV